METNRSIPSTQPAYKPGTRGTPIAPLKPRAEHPKPPSTPFEVLLAEAQKIYSVKEPRQAKPRQAK